MKGFFSRPYEFSFKDLLVAVFCGTFLYFGWQALKSEQALAVVNAFVPLVGIIMGGYFVQETSTIWFNRSQGITLPTSYYQPPVINQEGSDKVDPTI